MTWASLQHSPIARWLYHYMSPPSQDAYSPPLLQTQKAKSSDFELIMLHEETLPPPGWIKDSAH